MTRPTLRNRYPFIFIWGYMMGSNEEYIVCEANKALDQGAPYDAIYSSVNDTWKTVADLTAVEVRENVLRAFGRSFAH